MYTLGLIGLALAIIALIMDYSCWYDTASKACVGLGGVFVVLMIASRIVSTQAYSTEYTKVDCVSYVTDAGYVETLTEGEYYTDGTNYYTQEMDKANWIPFAPCEYMKMDLPSNAINSDSFIDNESNLFCTSCGNELGEGDRFCAECGAAVEVKE